MTFWYTLGVRMIKWHTSGDFCKFSRIRKFLPSSINVHFGWDRLRFVTTLSLIRGRGWCEEDENGQKYT